LDVFVGGSLALLVAGLFIIQLNHVLIGRTALELEFGIVTESALTRYERLTEVFGPLSIHWILPTPLAYEAMSPFRWEEFRKKPPSEEKEPEPEHDKEKDE